MGKEKNYQFKLVKGQYAPLDAKEILLGLINSKINFHRLENFSNEIRFNKNTEHSKIRIELLNDALENISDLINSSIANGMDFKIEGTIEISLVPAKIGIKKLKNYFNKTSYSQIGMIKTWNNYPQKRFPDESLGKTINGRIEITTKKIIHKNKN